MKIRAREWRVDRSKAEQHVVSVQVRRPLRRVTFLSPFDHIEPVEATRRWRRVRPQHARARLAALIGSAHGSREPVAAADARIEIYPYQLEPALAVIAGTRRLLIADEVGLGKTIQAGLIIAERRRRDPEARILLVVPAALGRQWAGELENRYRCPVRLVDRTALDRAARDGGTGANPWTRTGVSIVSADYLKQPHVLDGIPLLSWDLLIVDEAHEVTGHTVRHAACDELARRARHVVLLTATPHSGDDERYGRLLALGALPDVDTGEPLVFRRTRADVGLARLRRVRWRRVRLSPAEVRLLDVLGEYEQFALRHAGRDRALLLLSVFRKRALSTVYALVQSLERRLEWLSAAAGDEGTLWQQPPLVFADDDDDGAKDLAVLTQDYGLPAAAERRWLSQLIDLARASAMHDSKVRALDRILSRASEPVVVFTEFLDSLEALRHGLSQRHHVVWLHGQQTSHERAESLHSFVRGDARVLLTTDVAGQGLNLQHAARWVVCVEVPWNPVRLEQRIGRVDRIGQTRPVHATILLSAHAAEAPLLAASAVRALSAQRALGSSMLADVAPPSTAQVAAAVLTRVPLPHAARSADVPLCRRWRRTAQAAARMLMRRRRCFNHCRNPPPDGGRVFYTTAADRFRGLGTGRQMLLVFAAPLADGNGSVLERHVVAVRAPRPAPAPDGAGSGSVLPMLRSRLLQRLLSAEVAGRLESRRRRLARIVAQTVQRRTSVDEAIGSELCARAIPAEVQTTLFARDGLREFDRGREAAKLIAVERDRVRHERAGEMNVSVSQPLLVLVVA